METNENNNIKKTLRPIAKLYLHFGFSVIPVSITQQAFFEYSNYDNRIPTDTEMHSWFEYNNVKWIALLTGSKHWFFALNIDTVEDFNLLEKYWIKQQDCYVKIWNLSKIYYFKLPKNIIIPNNINIWDWITINSDFWFTVVPTSIHFSDNNYETVRPLKDINQLSEAPKELLEAITNTLNTNKPVEPVPIQNIDTNMAVIEPIWDNNSQNEQININNENLEIVKEELINNPDQKVVVSNNDNVWIENNDLNIVNNIEIIKPNTAEVRVNKTDYKINIAVKEVLSKIKLYVDADNNSYCEFDINNHTEFWPVDSKGFKNFITLIILDDLNIPYSPNNVSTILSIISLKAQRYWILIPVWFRISWSAKENNIYYDLSDKFWRHIEINTNWWTIKSEWVKFIRNDTQKNQIVPVSGWDIKLLLKYINIDKQDQILFFPYLISLFDPSISHPICFVQWEHWSWKSLLSKILRELIDPSKQLMSFLQDNKNLESLILNNYLLVFDNISSINNKTSDTLCRIVTGIWVTNKAWIDSFVKRCIVINWINNVAKQPDLVERSITFNLLKFWRENLISENELWSSFEKDKSLILGAIFDIIVKALKIIPTIHLNSVWRLADFTYFWAAVSIVLWYTQEEFLDVYFNNTNEQSTNIIESNIEAMLLVEFMNDKPEVILSMTELFYKLRSMAEIRSLTRHFPTNPSLLGKLFKILKSTLSNNWIDYTVWKDGCWVRGRYVRIVNTKYNSILLDDALNNNNSKMNNNSEE